MSVGGFGGDMRGQNMDQCYATGNVNGGGGDYIGGFGGYMTVKYLVDCYATGDVTGGSGSSYVGGFGGMFSNANTYMYQCYSIGYVTGTSNLGGLLGGLSYATVYRSYYDSTTSGRSDTGKGIPKTTTQMHLYETFKTTSTQWNITTIENMSVRNESYIWNIVNETTYPFFTWQPISGLCEYTSGNWEIDLGEGCVINTDYNISPYNVSFIGVGNVTFNSTLNICNFGDLSLNQEIYIDSDALVYTGDCS